MTEKKLQNFFAKNGIKATTNHFNALKTTIYYATIGDDHLPAILFIHGAPASMIIYKDYFKNEKLLKQFSMYAVDRPGYGITNGNPIPSIKKQAEMVAPLAERIQRVHQPLIVVAVSYGASIACRLVMDYPTVIQGLVLISPSLAPRLERMFWITPWIQKTFLKNWIPKRHYAVVEEKISHQTELKKMLPLWNRIDIPVYYLQSEKDWVVYPSNADFARKYLVSCPSLQFHFFKGRRHDVYSRYHEIVTDKILKLYQIITTS